MAFNIGDKVLAKFQPKDKILAILMRNQKLSMRYFGPFTIIEAIGLVAYEIQLPRYAKIHLMFHVSQLNLFKGDFVEQYVSLSLTTSKIGPILQSLRHA